MMQIYSEKSSEIQMQPKLKTINFLLSYSKSIHFIKLKSFDFDFEIMLN